MVLTLANGGVYFFQAGTEELVNEWVQTCNYWAARQSKEPLIGGVSNMEYGWNRVMDPVTRVRSMSEDNHSQRDENEDGLSVKSGRSGRSRLKDIAATVRADKSPYADRTFINEWKPPMPPSVPSNHDEETQLEALQKHVAYLKTELKQHNELRTPMTNLVGILAVDCMRPLLLMFSVVPTSLRERNESSEQLGKEVSIPLDGDRQVRVIH